MFAHGSYASASVEPPPTHGTDNLYSLATVLDEINEGAIFLNAEAQLVWHNRAFDKLLVENREGHLLVAAVIEFAGDIFQDLYTSYDTARAGERGMDSIIRDVTIGRIAHELHATFMPKGMLGPEGYLLCLVKRSASRWSSYQEHLRQEWGLTEREAQVAVECLRGKKNLEIADQLSISVETVNKHLDKVYQKAGVRGRAELASRMLDSGL
ncbi:MAG TPA: LuxR C-terminal-related transcriptional regulator [Blastocatellia bacterium]|nr:LuxR C-terminal-related transcriptional regulator [Blastocatellia bacterium]